MKTIYGFICLALFGTAVNGQVRQPHSLYFLETIPQISQMNPAFQPRANGYVALPLNVNVDFRSDLAVKDLLQKQGNQWYMPFEKKYDYNQLYKSIGEKATMFNVGVDADMIGFGFRTGKGYFSFGLSEHVSANVTLPSDLFNITDKGFPDKTSLDFSPLRVQSIAYMQLSIGYSHKVTDRLTIGVNMKPLIGQAVGVTKIDKFKIYTGEQQWDINAKGNVYTSLPVDHIYMDEKNRIESVKFRDFDDYTVKDWIKDYGTGFNNSGIAFDLGAAYKIGERLTVSAALNNLGFIFWNKDLNGISFNGKYAFDGVYYDTSKDDNKIGDLFKSLGDSIADAMEYKVRHDKFRTALAPVFHAGATFGLSKSVSVGLLSRSVFWQKGVRQSFNASLNLQPYSFVAFNAGATWQVKGNMYLGGGFMFLLGPLQFYLLVDNTPVFYSSARIDNGDDIGEKSPYIIPERLKTFTLRTGLNFIFGRHGYVNKPMLDKGKSSWN